MKERLIYIVIIILLVLTLIFNGVKNAKNAKDVKNYEEYYEGYYNNYLQYLIILRLDRQSDIYYMFSSYIDNLINDKDSINDFSNFISGINVFTHTEMIEGAYNIVYEKNDAELIKLLNRISLSNSVRKEELSKLNKDGLNKLKQYYTELSNVLNRNQEKNSLTYFISISDYSDEGYKTIRNEINALLDAVDLVYDK